MATCQLGNIELLDYQWVEMVALRAEMESVLVANLFAGRAAVSQFCPAFSVSADSLHCHFGKEGISFCGFAEAKPGVFPRQSLPPHPLETHCPTSSRLAYSRDVP